MAVWNLTKIDGGLNYEMTLDHLKGVMEKCEFYHTWLVRLQNELPNSFTGTAMCILYKVGVDLARVQYGSFVQFDIFDQKIDELLDTIDISYRL